MTRFHIRILGGTLLLLGALSLSGQFDQTLDSFLAIILVLIGLVLIVFPRKEEM